MQLSASVTQVQDIRESMSQVPKVENKVLCAIRVCNKQSCELYMWITMMMSDLMDLFT